MATERISAEQAANDLSDLVGHVIVDHVAASPAEDDFLAAMAKMTVALELPHGANLPATIEYDRDDPDAAYVIQRTPIPAALAPKFELALTIARASSALEGGE